MLVNIVSNIVEELWKSQEGFFYDSGPCKFIYSQYPLQADIHIFFGITPNDQFVHEKSKTILILNEPPEILNYRKSYLSLFSAIYGPNFGDLASSYKKLDGPPLLPLHIGVTFEKGNTRINSNLKELSHPGNRRTKSLSAISSNKVITPLQRKRHLFLQSLKNLLGEDLQIFGRGVLEIADKWEILSQSTHHISLENSIHNHYWSEKLADSIFARNFTYYSGAPNIHDYFDSDSIMQIDTSNPEESALKVAEHFYSGEISSESLERNYSTLKDNYNIFKVSEHLVSTDLFNDLERKSLNLKFHKSVNYRNAWLQKLYSLETLFVAAGKKRLKL